MDQNVTRERTRKIVSDMLMLAIPVAPMVLAATIIAVLSFTLLRAGSWPSYVWLITAPVIYLVWVVLFLSISALMVSTLARYFPKPRYKALSTNDPDGLRGRDLGIVMATVYSYSLYEIVNSLPLLGVLKGSKWLQPLLCRSYASSLHVGNDVWNLGALYDPDLTEIGERAVIGGGAVVAAHSLVTRQDGGIIYVSAPVKIGDRATIGGESRVALGCTIAEDAIVEPGSVLAAFTKVGPGEVWGGNPASFRRNRNGSETSTSESAEHENIAFSSSTNGSNGTDSGNDARAATPDQLAEIRQLVVNALELDPADIPAELSSDTCPSWDSLGQIAIASAVFDRFGVTIDDSNLFRIRSLPDIAAVIAGRPLIEPSSDGEGEPQLSIFNTQPSTGHSLTDVGQRDLEMLPLLGAAEGTKLLAQRYQNGSSNAEARAPLQVAIAATFTAQPVATSLRLWGNASGFDIDCRFADYNQIVQTLLDESSVFGTNRDGVNVALIRTEDLMIGSSDQVTSQIEQITSALRQFIARGTSRGQLLVGSLPPVVSTFAHADAGEVDAIRHQWRVELESISGVELFDLGHLVERIGIDDARSNSGEVLHRSPYSPRLYQELGIALIRQIRSKRRSPAKVIAIDCDNTLWGGVVGEVGMDGIQLGPDGPGRSFQLFQQYLKHLKNRGILLSVVSRNEERDVLDVFEKHPDMILRPDDIATWAVNWNHKSENLAELANEMNLGIDSFVFLDDDPAVRLEVATRRPEVHVVPLPDDPADYCETLSRLWLFDGAQATAVDAARTRMMQEESKRKREQREVGSLDQFLASLELRVEMGEPSDQEWPRVAQLTQRTNQFSLSLKRRTLEEVKTLGPDTSVLVLRARDRFGDYGLVGVGIVLPGQQPGTSEIDTLLMSCRALGRGVEDAFLHGIARVAAAQGSHTLIAPFVQGPRNNMFRDFLVRSGFSEIEPTMWTLAIAELAPFPAHVDFHGPEREKVAALP